MDAPGFRLDHTPPYVGKEGQRADSINYLLPEDVYARDWSRLHGELFARIPGRCGCIVHTGPCFDFPMIRVSISLVDW